MFPILSHIIMSSTQLYHPNRIEPLLFQFFAGAVSSIFLLVAAPKFGLGGIWAGLTLFMSLRAVAGFWR
jgi:Na+-driven multidrug efflux pump